MKHKYSDLEKVQIKLSEYKALRKCIYDFQTSLLTAMGSIPDPAFPGCYMTDGSYIDFDSPYWVKARMESEQEEKKKAKKVKRRG